MCVHAAPYFKEVFGKSIVTNFDRHISTNKTVSNCKVSVSIHNSHLKNILHKKKQTTTLSPRNFHRRLNTLDYYWDQPNLLIHSCNVFCENGHSPQKTHSSIKSVTFVNFNPSLTHEQFPTLLYILSIPKCSAFCIDNTQWNLANEVANLTYNMVGYVLPFTDHIRDLGVYHDSRLKYDEHNMFVVLKSTIVIVLSHTLSTVLLRDQC